MSESLAVSFNRILYVNFKRKLKAPTIIATKMSLSRNDDEYWVEAKDGSLRGQVMKGNDSWDAKFQALMEWEAQWKSKLEREGKL